MSQGEGEETIPLPPSITEAESTSNPKKGNGGRPRSNVWDHFTCFQDADGIKKAKCNYCEYGQVIGTEISTSVKEALYELYNVYKLLHQPPSDATTQGEDSYDIDFGTPYVLVDKYKKQKRQTGEESANDLDVYLTEKERSAGNVNNFDILAWWKVNQPRLPILAHLARDVLSVPISTVAFESAFSAGGRVLDPFRSSLTPKIVESLICTQDWMRKSKQPISIEEVLQGLQKHEEALMSIGISGSSDVNKDNMET